MKDSNKQAFVQMLIGVAFTYGKEVNEFMIAAFWEVLKEYEWEDVQQAFIGHLGDREHGQFMPKPADIKRRIKGNGEERVHDAWITFDKAFRCHGPYQSFIFEDSIITAVITDLGGWSRLLKINETEYSFYRKDFLERYRRYLRMEKLPPVKVLLGLEASSNASLGVKLPEPIFIGDEEKCKQLLIGIRLKI